MPLMLAWIFRILALLGVAGCGIWIGTSPREVEPYITLTGIMAGVLTMFRDKPKAEVTLALRLQGEHLQAFVFENIGNAPALSLDMKIHYRDGQSPPVYQHKTELPLVILYPRQRHLVRITCVIGSGAQFDVKWGWTNRGFRPREVRRAPIRLEYTNA